MSDSTIPNQTPSDAPQAHNQSEVGSAPATLPSLGAHTSTIPLVPGQQPGVSPSDTPQAWCIPPVDPMGALILTRQRAERSRWKRVPALITGYGAFLWLAVAAIPVTVLVAILGGNPASIQSLLLAVTVAELAVMVAATAAVTGSVSRWREFLQVKGFNLKHLGVGVLAGAGMWLALQLANYGLVTMGVKMSSSTTAASLSGLTGGWRVFLWYVATPFIIPLLEEMFYRGMILSSFQTGIKNPRVARILGVLFATVWFGLAHAQGFSSVSDWFIVIWTGLVGLVNSLLVLKQKHIWGAYGLHATYNGATVLVTTLLAALGAA